MVINVGSRLGHYEIIAPLGAGGMGEVYLAQDTRLGRKVALKFLPELFTADRGRLSRFAQEARAASALNHPNIITIHEIGEGEGTHYIATEFVEGETLRQHAARVRPNLPAALDLIIQVARALVAAHDAGIVHRDIKPENVMVRTDGYVKVLDFGLAKLTEQEQPTLDAEAPTAALVQTEPGRVLGTVQYMSPEQARALEVDARTDIFSLGIMLYELVTGRLPFMGQTATDVLAAILQTEPPPPSSYAPDVPRELERISTKMLRKDRDERYQSVKDLLIDLKDLRQELEFAARLERSTPPQAHSAAVTPEGAARAPQQTAQDAAVQTSAADARPTSSAEYLVGEIKRHKLGALIALIALACAAVGLFMYLHARDTEVAIDSIAVLPFANQNHDPDTEYLSDGLTESVINSLTQLPNLRVIARNSVFRYKGKETDPLAIGHELGVRAVVTGRAIQRGDNLVVSVELVDVRDNKQVWGEQYNRKLSDIFAVQAEIAQEISAKLRLRLTGAEQQRVTKHYTDNVAAYQLYLRGRYNFNKFSPEGLTKSIDYYNQAIALDPTYALAYAGLSGSYGLQADIGLFPARDLFPKARAAADKALALDNTLAEAHVAAGNVSLFYDWDWAAVEREVKRAIELNPNNADAHMAYASYLKARERHAEYMAEAKRAQEFDPLAPLTNMEVAEAFYFTRQYDAAIEQGRKTLELDPHFFLTYHVRARAFEQKGMYAEAIAEYKRAIETIGRDPSLVASLGHVYAQAGQRDEAQKILAELLGTAKQRYLPSYLIAKVYAGLGDKEQAFAWLDKAYAERYFLLIWLNGEPQFDNLHADPRFADLVRKVGL